MEIKSVMTQKEYAKYLGEIIEEDIDIDAEDLTSQFYGYFQIFMPNGIGLKKVFEPLENGNALYERVFEIFKSTEKNFNELSEKGLTPGYFCPPTVENENTLIEKGNQFISNLILFAEITNDKAFIKMVNSIKNVEVISSKKCNKENETNIIFHEIIDDWFINNTNCKITLEVLSEAYYSIGCDYYLSYYFQYPRYEHKLNNDVFKPYFEIWKSGHVCWFESEKLIISK